MRHKNLSMSRRIRRTNLFSKDISSLLYAYGDVPQPLQSTVHCVDELVVQYLADICADATRVAQNSSRNRVKLEDFKFVLRRDPVKLARAEELITTNKVITEAKKQFNETDNSSLKRYREEEVEEEEEGEEIDADAGNSRTRRSTETNPQDINNSNLDEYRDVSNSSAAGGTLRDTAKKRARRSTKQSAPKRQRQPQ